MCIRDSRGTERGGSNRSAFNVGGVGGLPDSVDALIEPREQGDSVGGQGHGFRGGRGLAGTIQVVRSDSGGAQVELVFRRGSWGPLEEHIAGA